MHRCLQLALLGQGNVAPNPMVGAVLVYHDRIIGEGYHHQYGGPHAEVHCINSVKPEEEHLIPQSAIYVSLEPCAHYGKTPPCADLIIDKRIPKVVVGCRDPFSEVNGKGIEKLQAAGIEVTVNILENECRNINKRFFTFHTKNRPYIILKWAQTGDGKIAAAPTPGKQRLLISNSFTNRIVHKWRSEEMAILVGTRTALYDDPELTTRLWPGKNPIRLVIDKDLKLPSSLKIFNSQSPVIVFNFQQHDMKERSVASLKDINYYRVSEDANMVHQILNALHSLHIQSVIVEGGAILLQSFIDSNLWDEARIICNEQLIVGEGIAAPALRNQVLQQSENFLSDTIKTYRNKLNIQ